MGRTGTLDQFKLNKKNLQRKLLKIQKLTNKNLASNNFMNFKYMPASGAGNFTNY